MQEPETLLTKRVCCDLMIKNVVSRGQHEGAFEVTKIEQRETLESGETFHARQAIKAQV